MNCSFIQELAIQVEVKYFNKLALSEVPTYAFLNFLALKKGYLRYTIVEERGASIYSCSPLASQGLTVY